MLRPAVSLHLQFYITLNQNNISLRGKRDNCETWHHFHVGKIDFGLIRSFCLIFNQFEIDLQNQNIYKHFKTKKIWNANKKLNKQKNKIKQMVIEKAEENEKKFNIVIVTQI